MLLVLAGPSGVGKGAISKQLLARVPALWSSVSYTTRAPRPTEADGVDYHFVTPAEFREMRDAGGFLEWFEVFGELKGTPREPVEERLAAGVDVLLEIDVQGALKVKREFPEAVLVFVKPPSPEELRRRLVGRGTESPADLDARLAAAAEEEARAGEFDVVVVNDDLERVVTEVAGILAGSPPPRNPGDLPHGTVPSLMTPRMEQLLERVDSKFTLVTLSAMRAREINDYYNQLAIRSLQPGT